MKFVVLILIISFVIYSLTKECVVPPVAKDFNIQNYKGMWYEIGRIQTFGKEKKSEKRLDENNLIQT